MDVTSDGTDQGRVRAKQRHCAIIKRIKGQGRDGRWVQVQPRAQRNYTGFVFVCKAAS